MASLGCQLALTGRNASNLEQTAKECKEINGAIDVLTVVGDLRDERDVRAVIDKTIERFKGLDVLINNAGVLEFGTIETTTLESFDHVMGTNVRSVFHLTSLATPHLIKSKGTTITISFLAT
jgi:NAD(P)-dependent dehydrogenase (short-subunit alcohol dehydrogenase family)